MMSFTGGPKPIYFRLVIRVFNSPRTDEDKLKQELLVACESIHKTKHKTVPKTKVIAVFKEKTVCEKCGQPPRSEEHTSELQSHSFISYAVFCLKKKKKHNR